MFPLLVALVLLVTKNSAARDWIVRCAVLVIACASIYTAVRYFQGQNFLGQTYIMLEGPWIGYGMLAVEAVLAVYIIAVSIKKRRPLSAILVLLQAPVLIWFELTHGHDLVETAGQLMIDKLALIMILIVGIIGGLICLYALSYMKHYHDHHTEVKQRQPFFFFMLFLFLSVMFGLVLSNNLIWLYFFWEITTLSSFLLIGYAQDKISTRNAFRALELNLLGGVAFVAAILYCGFTLHTVELSALLSYGLATPLLLVPVMLLSFAGIVKAAQLPFSPWLLGAMVAPTPTSALLHSSTMVKAGVYLLIRLAPGLHDTIAGTMVIYVGAITFLVASLLAIGQSDGKKILAYSTIANLGLIVTCAGLGTYESLWVAVLLIVFHATAKSLMFLSVGSVEMAMGSRDVEDMKGLVVHMPRVSIMMVVGIAGMFLAPFGMLISKWAAMKAFVDSHEVLLLLILVFGSSATLFYWTKWLGNIMTVQPKRQHGKVIGDEWFSLGAHTVLTIVTCMLFPLIANTMIEPYLVNIFGASAEIISRGDITIMLMMLAMLLILPLSFLLLPASRSKRVDVYMAGENTGDNMTFRGSMGREQRDELSNWYMGDLLNEHKLMLGGSVLCTTLILIEISIMLTRVL